MATGNWFSDAFANPKFKQFASESLQDFGYGLANSTDIGGAFGAATNRMGQMQPYRDQMAQQQAAEAKLADEGNMTTEWLKINYPQYTNLPVDRAWSLAMADETAKRTQMAGGGASSMPSNVQEWEYYNQLDPQAQSQYLTMKRANTPLNIGTGFVTADQANPGQVLGAPIAIQNEQKAYDTNVGGVLGTAEGENLVAAESVSSKLPGLRSVVSELSDLAKTATYTQTGQLVDTIMRETGQEPSEAAIARAKYIAAVDNQVLPLLRDTFGAAFTQKEGETLRATLGNANASPAEKQAILEAFIAQKERDVAGMQSRMDRRAAPAGNSDVDSILQKYGVQ